MNPMTDIMIAPHAIPYEQEAEQLVLGAMLREESLIPTVKEKLAPRDFYGPAHQAIASAVFDLALATGEVPLVALKNALLKHRQLEQIGGLDYLRRLIDDYGFDTANVTYNADIVRDASRLRQLSSLGQEITARAGRAIPDDLPDFLTDVYDQLFALDVQADGGDSLTPVSQAVSQAIIHADKVAAGELSAGVATGFGHIDRVTGSMQPGDLWVLAAATSIGKTAMALAIAANVARAGGTVLYISLEMDRRSIANRLLGAEAQIEGLRLRSGNLSKVEHASRKAAADEMAGWRLTISDRATNIGEIGIRARQMAAQWREPLSLIVVDHLQLLSSSRDGRGDTRAQEVGALAAALKGLAMATSTPILALSQLNRASVTGTGPPSIHALKESGDIENCANTVILLHRPADDDFDSAGRSILWGRVAKARDGQVTSWPTDGHEGIKLAFRTECVRLEPMTL